MSSRGHAILNSESFLQFYLTAIKIIQTWTPCETWNVSHILHSSPVLSRLIFPFVLSYCYDDDTVMINDSFFFSFLFWMCWFWCVIYLVLATPTHNNPPSVSLSPLDTSATLLLYHFIITNIIFLNKEYVLFIRTLTWQLYIWLIQNPVTGDSFLKEPSPWQQLDISFFVCKCEIKLP